MRRTLASVMLLAWAGAAHASEECPASLALHVPELEKSDEAIANQYASCVSFPWLPLVDAAEAKFVECAKSLPAQQSEELRGAIQWVDHIANGFGGCETRLEIRRKQ